jgi:hypothetical protein
MFEQAVEIEQVVESASQHIRGILADGDTVALTSLPAKILTSLEVTEQVRDLIEMAIILYGDQYIDSIANNLYYVADDLKRRAHPEWPDYRPMIRDLRHDVPSDIHPSAQGIVHEWLAEAESAVYPPEVLRLVRLAIDKIVDELRWEAAKRNPRDRVEFQRRADQFKTWLDRYAAAA